MDKFSMKSRYTQPYRKSTSPSWYRRNSCSTRAMMVSSGLMTMNCRMQTRMTRNDVRPGWNDGKQGHGIGHQPAMMLMGALLSRTWIMRLSADSVEEGASAAPPPPAAAAAAAACAASGDSGSKEADAAATGGGRGTR